MAGIIEDIVKNDPRYSFGTGNEGRTPVEQPTGEPKPDGNPSGQVTGEPKPDGNPSDQPTGEPKPDGNPTDPKPQEPEVKTPSPEELQKQFLGSLNERLGTQYADLDTFQSDYSQLNTLRESEKTLKEQLGKYQNPFGEDAELAELYGFRQATKRELADYFILKNLDLQNADSMDIMVADAIMNNPQLRGREAQVRRVFERKYNLSNEDLEDDELETYRTEFDMDSSKARQSLAELKAQIKAPEFNNPYAKQTVDPETWTQHENQWKNAIPQIVSDFSKFEVYESAEAQKEGKKPFTSVDIPKDIMEGYNQKLFQYISDAKAEPTQENVKALKDLMVQDYIFNNYLNIANSYAAAKLEENNKMWKERTGVDLSKAGNGVVPNKSTSEVEKFNADEQDRILRHLGVRRG